MGRASGPARKRGHKLDILRNQVLIFRYKSMFGILFTVILNCETAHARESYTMVI